MVTKYKTLAESAGDILSSNVSGKRGEEEKFGADNKGTKIDSPNDGSENLGGPDVEPTETGVKQATDAAPTATPPGKPAPVGQQPPKSIKEEDDKSDDDDKDSDDKDDKDDSDDKKDDVKEEKVDEESEHQAIGSPEPVSSVVKSYFKSKGAIEEDIKAIFAGEDLSEDFIKKATTIYEAAVIAKTTEIVEDIEKHYAEQLEEAATEIQESLSEKVDGYLNYMVEEWVKDNEIAIEKGIRAELTEDFITGLKNLFVEHYLDIPDEKVNVVEELASKVEDLEKRVNEEIERGVKLKKELNETKKAEIVKALTEGLTDTQADKIKGLAEAVDFTNEKEYKEKVSTIKESYFPEKQAPKAVQLDEESVEGDPRGVVSEDVKDREMEIYAKAISKTLKV